MRAYSKRLNRHCGHVETMRKSWLGFLSCSALAISGCIGDRITRPVRVKGVPNTFKHNPQGLGEKVITVKVLHFNRRSKSDTLVWKIEATREIPGWGFSATVGQVPDGFEQIIPVPPKKFRPVPGEEYIIYIGARPASVHAQPTLWTAEPWEE